MTGRTHSTSVVFKRPFELKGVDRVLPPGSYLVATDEELIEELSFPAYRRVLTTISVPGAPPYASTIETIPIDPQDLEAAQARDGAPS